MTKEAFNKLVKPFPAEYVKEAPKGKFGKYVSHSRYVERLRDSNIKYSWSVEPVYGDHKGVKRLVGAIGTITLEGHGSYQGVGDVDTFKLDNKSINDGSLFKDAESDAFKRACMRFGLGVELWSGDVTEEEFESSTPSGKTTVIEKPSEVVVDEVLVAPSKSATTSSVSNEDSLFCPKPCFGYVNIILPEEKSNPASADFRCSKGKDCENADQKGQYKYAKSWYKNDKNLPSGFKEAYDEKTMTILKDKGVEVKPRSLDDIKPGEAPF
jgi:hypothetical protein